MPFLSWLIEHRVIDPWSLQHLMGWFGGFFLLSVAKRIDLQLMLFLALLTGLGWEIGEMHLEVIHHIQWRENLLNRWVADPLFDVAGSWMGWMLGSRLRRLVFRENGE